MLVDLGGIKVRVTIQRVRTWCGAFLPDAIGMRALELAEKAEGHSQRSKGEGAGRVTKSKMAEMGTEMGCELGVQG